MHWNDSLLIIATSVFEEKLSNVEKLKSRPIKAINYLVGEGIRATNGNAKPNDLKIIFERLFKEKYHDF